MAHIRRDRVKLLSRVRRLKGQVDALERAIQGGYDCAGVLQQIAACRGAVNGLLAHVLEGHVREHLIGPDRQPTKAEIGAMEELFQVMKSYLK